MSKTYSYCNNCGKPGHLFHQCKHPITSLGIIAFRENKGNLEYLMIRRKDTLGYVDFLRGKYSLNNILYLKNIIDEMTIYEKNKILENDFNTLWNDLWGENIGIQYRSEESISEDKFNILKKGFKCNNEIYSLKNLINNSKTNWVEAEWGFPKGRKNYQEKDLIAARREFEEETGYSKDDLKIIQNIVPFEEIFTGSNYKSYKHKYYIAKLENGANPVNSFQDSEVSSLKWVTFNESYKIIRPYNLEKKEILSKTNRLLLEYRLY
jgi:8-oxo-dGTP pyrophosphatase MutT (NUDIX family)